MSYRGPMEEIDEGPSTFDQVRRFGPPAVLLVVALLFVFQNTNDARFDFLWFDFTAPLWLMLLGSMVVGGVIALGAARRRRKRKERED